MLRTLWRLLLGGLALALAIPLGIVLLGTGLVLDPPLRGLLLDLIRAGLVAGFREVVSTLSPAVVLDAALAFAKSLALLVTLPPLMSAVIGETLRFRALGWYAGACGLMTAGLPWVAQSGFRLPTGASAQAIDARATALLLLSGSAAGLAYWLVAGWSAGGPRRPPPETPDAKRFSGNTPSPSPPSLQ